MNKKAVAWLYKELPLLVEKGVLGESAAEDLRKYYDPAERPDPARTLITLFAIIGGALIGLGIILLFAHNWSDLDRPLRTVLSLLPLVIGQGLYLFVFLKRRNSAAWREGSSSFLMIALAACLGLIGQTYNLNGDFQSLMLTWVVLSIPLLYIMPSATAALLYCAGITVWAGAAQNAGGQALLFWPLSFALAPLVVRYTREDRYSPRSILLYWTMALLFCCATGISLEKVMPGLWIVIYAGYFAILYCVGKLWFKDPDGLAERPFEIVGSAGIVVLAYLLTFNWPWEDIGWNFLRESARFHHDAAVVDYGLALLFPLAAGILSVRLLVLRSGNLLLVIFPFLAAAAYAGLSLAGTDRHPAIAFLNILFNLYLLLTGILLMIRGLKSMTLIPLNAGMAVIAALILTRFLDADIGLLLRGIVFICVGAVFLTINLVISRRRRAAS